ncbi:methionine--tRNA ligase [Micromonospora sp. NBC_01655]|uniref:methionine--tRNA ligase n=1 Tax=Micromonospora sp. NBC_01655 TaxID=2975983 RepID=UPI002255343C|nr:methionine--tRNA ligase [Micromonospora sp. NBC_01655]MCX4472950.1 methionine--tRNA ligase [Micromonospora sp. NBC_01655]
MPARFYVTTTIPYVNARPHLGFALELVQADVLARHRRQRGDQVRFLSGTDDNSLKNVLAADAEGLPTQELVDRNAAAFEALRQPLALSPDDFIRTSRDPRHRPGVERLWRACAAAGDLYRKHYQGLYCVGCEQFYNAAELRDGRCPEHGTPPQLVTEQNWFFRLSRYQGQLHDLIDGGQLRIEPAVRRNEVLSFIAAGLHDLSISRSHTRARGWGIPVPEDPDQVVYVWWDALGNYVTALDYANHGPDYQHWWVDNPSRVHLLGKGVLRFHAVYWPAMLLSAGEPLPTDIFVHDYLTVGGKKISKSAGVAIDPVELVAQFGTDPVRWWLLRDVPRVGDADFTIDRLIARTNSDLADGLGNLINRVTTMVHRYRDGKLPDCAAPPAADAHRLTTACQQAPDLIAAALDAFDFRTATAAVWAIVDEANRYVEHVRPWYLARAERDGDSRAATDLDSALDVLVRSCQTLAEQIRRFLPDTADRIAAQCTPSVGRLPTPQPLFPRIATPEPRRSPARCS